MERPLLEQLYCIERRSTRQVAAVIGVSQPTARKLLRLAGVTLRDKRDRPPSIPKGSKLSPKHRAAISAAHLGKRRNYSPGENPRWKRQLVNCAQCDAAIWKKLTQMQHSKHFCNYKCHAQWKRNNPEQLPTYKGGPANAQCENCQVGLLRLAWQVRKGHRFFCSKSCEGKWKAQNVVGAKVYNWKGGYLPYYGETWLNARRAARERDKNTCQNCGKTKAEIGKNMDVHHKIRFRNFGLERHAEANALENLICYCPRCHKIIEEREGR